MRRFRPRFSVRTLGIFLTLACIYFGAWEVTKKSRVAIEGAIEERFPGWGACGCEIPGPLVVIRDEVDGLDPRRQASGVSKAGTRRYYLWLGWLTLRVPTNTRWTSPEPRHHYHRNRNAFVP